jgi:hypothetical protein
MRSLNWLPRLALLAAVGALLGGCETTDSRPAAVAAAPPGPAMSQTRAASECWMATEKTGQKLDLDRRADLVHGCIDKKMRGDPAA